MNASFSALNLSAGTYWLTFNSIDSLYGSSYVACASLVQISNGQKHIRSDNASAFILSGNADAVPVSRRQCRKQA